MADQCDAECKVGTHKVARWHCTFGTPMGCYCGKRVLDGDKYPRLLNARELKLRNLELKKSYTKGINKS